MDEYAAIRSAWDNGAYLDVLSTIWTLPDTDNYPYFQSVIRSQDIQLHNIIFRACRQAVTTAWSDAAGQERAKQWLDSLLNDFRPPIALIDHGDGGEAEAYRAELLQAYLLCTSAACNILHSHELLTAALLQSQGLDPIFPTTGLPPAFFIRLVQSLLPEQLRHKQPYQATKSETVNALLVSTAQRQGITATLTVDRLSPGTGLCYPSPALAFVRRDQAFQESEQNACTYVQSCGFWTPDKENEPDLCWTIERRDGKPLAALTGPSLGLAFTLTFGKVLTGEAD